MMPKVETVMWLLPIVFMAHDFEEIIMMRPWLNRYGGQLKKRFPALADHLLPAVEQLSTSAFALIVAEEFIILSVLTYIAVEWGLYALWLGLLVVFLSHLLVHIGQVIVLRHYAPVMVTSVVCSVYCVFAWWYMTTYTPVIGTHVIGWAVVCGVVMMVNLWLGHRLAGKFEVWLRATFG
jgi:hypothetical protein